MIRRWLALTYYLYALQLAALSHFYFNPLYATGGKPKRGARQDARKSSLHTENKCAGCFFYRTAAGYIQPSSRSTVMPNPADSIAPTVVMPIMLAAATSLPPIAFAIT